MNTAFSGVSSDFRSQIEMLKGVYRTLWNSASGRAPAPHTPVSHDQQRRKERELDRTLGETMSALKNRGAGTGEEQFHHLKNTLRTSLFQSASLFSGIFDEPTRDRFTQSTDEFIRQARAFNPSVSIDDIYQALRNVWILNSIQLYLGRTVELTPSCFAYSMLYPVTDNILDSPDIDAATKRTLNRDFTLRLAGRRVPVTHPVERDAFRLFEMIEEEYDRTKFPLVYESLLAIQHGQTRSVRQFKADEACLLDELLDISFEKGGTSVLADGYLAAGDISAEDVDFLFGYGILLQVLDDLQDFEGDLGNNQMTLISSIAGKHRLDEITDRLLVFMELALARGSRPGFSDRGNLAELIGRSCRVLVLETIARHPAYYSTGYVKTMEEYSPVSFEYFQSLHERVKKIKHSTTLAKRRPEYSGHGRRTTPSAKAVTNAKLHELY